MKSSLCWLISLVCLCPAPALADTPAEEIDWTGPMKDTPYTLEVALPSSGDTRSTKCTLREGKRVVWSVTRAYIWEDQLRVHPKATFSALFDPEGFTLLDAQGQPVGHYDVLAL